MHVLNNPAMPHHVICTVLECNDHNGLFRGSRPQESVKWCRCGVEIFQNVESSLFELKKNIRTLECEVTNPIEITIELEARGSTVNLPLGGKTFAGQFLFRGWNASRHKQK